MEPTIGNLILGRRYRQPIFVFINGNRIKIDPLEANYNDVVLGFSSPERFDLHRDDLLGVLTTRQTKLECRLRQTTGVGYAGSRFTVTPIQFCGNKLDIAVDAPDDVRIYRDELLDASGNPPVERRRYAGMRRLEPSMN